MPYWQQDLQCADCIFCRGLRLPTLPKKGCPNNDTKLHLIVRLQFGGSVKYPFTVIIPPLRSTLNQSGSIRVQFQLLCLMAYQPL